MPTERRIRRYTAFFPGWATAFGAHEKDAEDAHGLIWLYGEDQLGLLLNPDLKEFLYPLLLGNSHEVAPMVALHESQGRLRIQEVELSISAGDHRPFAALMALLEGEGDLYLSQTYHLVYPSGTRILTLGRKPPLPLVYREIAPLSLQVL